MVRECPSPCLRTTAVDKSCFTKARVLQVYEMIFSFWFLMTLLVLMLVVTLSSVTHSAVYICTRVCVFPLKWETRENWVCLLQVCPWPEVPIAGFPCWLLVLWSRSVVTLDGLSGASAHVLLTMGLRGAQQLCLAAGGPHDLWVLTSPSLSFISIYFLSLSLSFFFSLSLSPNRHYASIHPHC